MAKVIALIFLLGFLVFQNVNSRSIETENILEELVRELSDHRLKERSVSVDGAVNNFKESPLVAVGAQTSSIRIGAFNIQIFGDRKYSKSFVKQYLLKIIPRYDILLIQEIRDRDGDTFLQLLMDLNEIRSYDSVLSERLGRSSSKEQYAYIYDPSKFEAESSYQYRDARDDFERPPYGVVLKSNATALRRFGLLGVHTKPSAAPEEISKMVDVYDDFKRRFKLEDVLIMGDFNAGCSYVTQTEWDRIELMTDKRFTWWIDNEADTTVSSSDCAYDRIVSAGSKMNRAIVPDSASIYRFDQAYSLRRTKADDISDHYPVEISLYGKLTAEASALTVKESFSVSGTIIIDADKDYGDVITNELGYNVTSYENSGEVAMIELTKSNVACNKVASTLSEFVMKAPGLLTTAIVSSVEAYIDTGILDDVYQFPGHLNDPDDHCDVTMQYKLNNVDVTISRAVMSP